MSTSEDREEQALDALMRAVMVCEHVYLIGNGGSAANAVHIANDWIAVGIKAHALTADVATLTAIANDYGYEWIFARQLSALMTERDLLVCLSGSGRSKNIWAAINIAKAKGSGICCMFGGYNDVDAKLIGDKSLLLQSGLDMQDAEERQILLGHEIMRRVKAKRELH